MLDHYSCSQPGKKFSFELRGISWPAELQGTDDWLQSVFHLDPEQVAAEKISLSPQASSEILPILVRQLHVIRWLLQFSQIPAFELGHVDKISLLRDSEQDYGVTLTLPYFDLVPSSLYERSIRYSAALIRYFLTTPCDGESRNKIYSYIDVTIREKLGAGAFGGRSTIPVLEKAYQKGIPITHLGARVYQLGWGCHAHLIHRSTSEKDSLVGAKLSHSKLSTSNYLKMAGIPVPKSSIESSHDQARVAAERIGWPVVVKPNDSAGGVGVTVDVSNADQFEVAFDHALKASDTGLVIVEEQIAGVCHRLFVHQGELLFAAKRLPIAVKGDGKSSIQQLIRSENKVQERIPPWFRHKALPEDEETIHCLAQKGLTLESIPAPDEMIGLRLIESTQWGGRGVDVTEDVHPENRAMACRIAEMLQLSVLGIDIISKDISLPWYENAAAINEVNSGPLLGVYPLTRKYIASYLDALVEDGGRIEVHLLIGGEAARRRGQELQREICGRGIACYKIDSNSVVDANQSEMTLGTESFSSRTKSLLLMRSVVALVLVIDDLKILDSTFPIDRWNSLEIVGSEKELNDQFSMPIAEINELVKELDDRLIP